MNLICPRQAVKILKSGYASICFMTLYLRGGGRFPYSFKKPYVKLSGDQKVPRIVCCLYLSSTHFGFDKVDENEKAGKVKTVFANVASKYDLMNDAMSLGIHRLWKDYYVNRINLYSNSKVVDVAGGTGDIAFRMVNELRKYPNGNGNVTVVDINENMIEVGKQRAIEKKYSDSGKLQWICADAESLPFESNSFDLYTIAFGIRNCTHVDKVISEAYRILKPGGRFTCLEFSQINRALSPFYDLYSFQVIPVLGQLLASDYMSYKYLVESIRVFPDQKNFAEMIKEANFTDITYENLTFGICSIHMGLKK